MLLNPTKFMDQRIWRYRNCGLFGQALLEPRHLTECVSCGSAVWVNPFNFGMKKKYSIQREILEADCACEVFAAMAR